MRTLILHFIHDERGQDLIEYTLLMAFISLGSAAIYVSVGGSLTTIWTSGSATLSNAVITSS